MREFGQDVKWGLDFGSAFAQEFSVRTGETAANIATVGGYGGVKKAYNEGRVTSTDFWSTGRAYAEGVYNTVTLGGGERAVDAYAEGKGAGGIALEAAKGVGEKVVPISEVKTLADPSKNAWEKAEAFAMGTAKVAGLAAGGLAAKNAIAQRLANKPGLVTESAAGADASMAPAEGAVAPTQPAPTLASAPSRGDLLRAKFGSISPGELHARINAERGLVGLRETLRPSGSRFYEAGFEARLAESQYPGTSPQRHFQQANRQLYEAMKADPEFATSMERLYPGLMRGVSPGARGAFPRRPPTPQLTWHHNPHREGVLELVPFRTHTAPGPVQKSLHPEREGGMLRWGGGR